MNARIVVLLLVASTLALGAALYLSKIAEVTDVEFATEAAARRADAVGEGKWLPSWLPADAIRIREAHNLDTNESWAKFSLTTPLNQPPAHCELVPLSDAILPEPMGMSRFPAFVRQGREEIKSRGDFALYSCRENDGAQRFLAIASDKLRAYTWLLRR